MLMVACQSCERAIGHYESRHAYQGGTVCHECFSRLIGTSARRGTPVRRRPHQTARVAAYVSVLDSPADPFSQHEFRTGHVCSGCLREFPADDLTESPLGWFCADCANPTPEQLFQPAPAREAYAPRSRRKTWRWNSTPFIVSGMLLGGGAIYLAETGKLSYVPKPEPVEAVISQQTSDDLEALDRYLHDAARFVAAKKLPRARMELVAAKQLIKSRSDPLAVARLPGVVNRLAEVDRLIAHPAELVDGPTTQEADAPIVWTPVAQPTADQTATAAPSAQPSTDAPPAADTTQPVPAPTAPANDAAPATQPASPVRVPSLAAAAGAPGAASDAADPNSLIARRADAWDNLVLGNVLTAGFQFRSILADFPDDRDCLIGLAYSQCKTGDPHKYKDGVASLEKLYAASPDAVSATNLAAVLLEENPSRGARVLADFLSRSKSINESVLNALGTSLVHWERTGPRAAATAALWASYAQSDAKLAASADSGKKRFGQTWLPAAVADASWTQYRAARAGKAPAGTAPSPTWPETIPVMRPKSTILH